MTTDNVLYYSDNLDVLRRHVAGIGELTDVDCRAYCPAVRSLFSILQYGRSDLRYRVVGANETTGMEISTSITAQDLETAKRIARERGILISSIRLEGGSATDFEENPQPMYEGAKGAIPARYASITTGASVLRFVSVILYIASAVLILLAIVAVAQSPSYAVPYAISGVIACAYSFAMAAVIGMLAGVGEAIRDIAISVTRKD
jgi:hypothetical protein